MSRTAKRVLMGLLCLLLTALAVFFALWTLKLSPDAPYNPDKPRTLMEALTASASREEWKAKLLPLWEEPVSEYEDTGAVFSALYDAAAQGEFSFRPSGEKNSFVLSCGENDLALLRYQRENGSWQQTELRCLLHGETNSIRILVPAGTVPTVNGVSVPDSALTETELPYEDMNEWELRFADSPRRREYTVSGLYLLPEVDAGDARLVLREGNCWSYEPADARTHSLLISAPSDAAVAVGGVTLDGSLVTARETVPVDVELPAELAASLPAYSRYELTGLYSASPAVTVTAADGTELTPIEGERGLLSYTRRSDTPPDEEVRKIAGDFLTDLCRYGAGQVFSDTMSTYTVKGSALQQFLFRAQGSLFWIRGTGLTLQESRVEDFIPLGEDACVCTARVVGTVKNYYMTYEAEFACQLLLLRTADGWKVADMAYE